MSSLLRITLFVLFALATTDAAYARRHPTHLCAGGDVMRPCSLELPGWGVVAPDRQFRPRGRESVARAANYGASAAIVAHPAGCPRRAFCGCGAAVRVFGHPRRDLWLASNWLRFPRAAPAPGMAAARRGHVFVLESHVGGNTWIVYDANSGRGGTRIHARSLAGYTVVNPRA